MTYMDYNNGSRYSRDIRIEMPEAVRSIIATLREHGYEAYAVGGCVRDSILGKEPKDWDITTSAEPERVKALFKRTIDTGIQHGTVTVMVRNTGYEVTTYRVDGKYEDSRHPSEVTFTANLEEDLRRRDFTINAMAYSGESGVVDCFDGIGDLNEGIIRCVGDAHERFTEDALRMLRAVRFGAVLDFDICSRTEEAIKELAPTIKRISRERIQAELDRLIMSAHADRVQTLYRTGLMKHIFGAGVMPEAETDIKELSERLLSSPDDHYIRWAVFASYADEAGSVLKSLKFDNDTIKICSRLVRYRAAELPSDEAGLRRTIVEIGKDIFGQYYLPYRMVMDSADTSMTESHRDIERIYSRIMQRGDCLSMKELAVNGRDLAGLGVEPGKRMGEILNRLFQLVLEDCTKNNKETLLEAAKNYT